MANLLLTEQETLEVRKFAVTAALGLCARGDPASEVVAIATAIEEFIVTDAPPPAT